MPQLAERQGEFALALLDWSQPVPAGCVAPDGRRDAKRFGVYRNNARASLIAALRESFPAVCRLVGEEYFCALAQEYATRHPPTSPVLLEYGATFPQFIEHFEPLAAFPYMADVARIERAWLEAYHAADEVSLDPALLAFIPDDQAGMICFTPHPSVRLVRSDHPALTIWRANVAAGGPGPADSRAGGESALLIRREAEVDVRAMLPEGAEFLSRLVRGQSLTEATAATLRSHAQFDVASHLAALLEGGIFVRYHLSHPEV